MYLLVQWGKEKVQSESAMQLKEAEPESVEQAARPFLLAHSLTTFLSPLSDDAPLGVEQGFHHLDR